MVIPKDSLAALLGGAGYPQEQLQNQSYASLGGSGQGITTSLGNFSNQDNTIYLFTGASTPEEKIKDACHALKAKLKEFSEIEIKI